MPVKLQAAIDFLKVSGIDGDSVSANHNGEINVETWSWAESEPGSRAVGAVAAAGWDVKTNKQI